MSDHAPPDEAVEVMRSFAGPIKTCVAGVAVILVGAMVAVTESPFEGVGAILLPVGALCIVSGIYRAVAQVADEAGIHRYATDAVAIPVLTSVWVSLEAVFAVVPGLAYGAIMLPFGVLAGFIVSEIVMYKAIIRKGLMRAGLIGALFTLLIAPATFSAVMCIRRFGPW